MRVFEIFRSIQGETTRAGVPMDFVRLAGCDLACTYCDTPAARDPKAGREMTIAQVLAALPRPPLAEVMITGGEPLLQAEDVNALVVELVCRGHEVMVETSGAHPIDLVDARGRRIVDVKTPGSGMADRMDWRNLERLTPRDEVKFVLTGRPDYDWAKEVVESRGLVARCPVLFGSAWPLLDPKALAGWLIEDALAVRLNLQIHKMLELP
jgi:7-carboxy-7-deazaguanine synthase